jgi:membrane protease YdiL (CAAX protease family)
MRLLRPTAALALLLFRHWVRASLPSRLRRDAGRRASAGVFRLAYLVMASGWGYTVGRAVGRLAGEEERLRGAAWAVCGAIGVAVVWSAGTRGPTMRGESSPLEASFLDTLPLHEATRLAVGLLERLFIFALGGSALVGLAAAAPARAIALAFVTTTAAVLVGEATMRLARVFFRAMTIARARAYLLVVGQLVFLLALFEAPALAKSARLGVLVAGWPRRAGRAFTTGEDAGIVLVVAAGIGALAILAVTIAERIGYDRIELSPAGRPRPSRAGELTAEGIDDVLRRREPGRWSTAIMTVYTLVATAVIVALAWNSPRAAAAPPDVLIRMVCSIATVAAFVVVGTRASRMAARDVTARPLLAPLPIEPRALLEGKVGRLRRDALVIAGPAVGLLGVPWSISLHVEIAWRLGATLLALALAAKAAASIAFLTVGAGSKRGPGGGFVVESLLVLVPLLGVATAPYAWSVVVPLVALALVAREAGRSGHECIRWLDDADDFDRETPIWRALLVLGAFQSAQVLGGRLAALSDLDEAVKLALAYAVSSIVLVGLTLHAQRDAPRMRALPASGAPAWLGAGAALGVASGGLALGYLLVLRRLGVELPASSVGSRAAVFTLAVVLAPPAEEMFFRGWLLPCIENELAGRARHAAAPVLAAFAFAAVHPPLAFVPVFVLGLVASFLFSRTRALGPGILAHIAHNAVAVLLAV